MFAAQVSAFIRMSCPGRLVAERVDPIISPGVTSGHVHTVHGGNGFDYITSYEQQRKSSCSSCPLKDDLSAYWTPQLYFQDPKSKVLEIVPLAGSGPGVSGGMTVYYEQRGPNLTALRAFPEGFRMVAGNPFQRSWLDVAAAPGNATSFACLNYDLPPTNGTHGLPNTDCPDGLRAQVYFPSCWNGKDLDTPDHSSHMAYPIGRYDNGKCPEGFPTQLISLFYEVLYDTSSFRSRWTPGSDPQPFVFAMGDKTGYGFHGDFVNGWDVDVLQNVTSQCNNDSGNISDCPPVADRLFTDDESHACQVPPRLTERINGTDEEPMMELPGCNPITGEGENAVPSLSCSNTPIPGAYKKYFTDVTSSLDWAYAGCAADNIGGRTFPAEMTWSFDMTVEYCVKHCKSKGYSLAGLEYADQCYCDNEYHGTNTAPNATILGNCWQPCAGDSSQICGGSAAMSVYKSCSDGSCDNAVYVNPSGSLDVFSGSGSSSGSSSNSTDVEAAGDIVSASSSASASASSASSSARKQRASTTLIPSVSSSSTTSEASSTSTAAVSSFTSTSLSTVSNDGVAVVTVTNIVTATAEATVSAYNDRKHRHYLKHRRTNDH
ncbi:WSC-domain-containing protein [Polychaeton citri CBS 116435]|uniref:WSC-domain-containing protein n=1 Tax=Polychaeton citri CBS 116435 TaxID=1314669 RepID=A0A9P4Q7A7_9PEZI|nr:WSC-domain-containing protein [Polychaeton citri CBS 116435]